MKTKLPLLVLTVLFLAGCGLSADPQGLLSGGGLPGLFGARSLTPPGDLQRFALVDSTSAGQPVLYRGSVPSNADLQSLFQQGVRTDICLLGESSKDPPVVAREKAYCAQIGMNFVNIPLPFDVEPPMSMATQFLQAVETTADQAAYVHCTLGRDRTGAMVAIYRIAEDGYSEQQALSEAESYGYVPTRFPLFTRFIQDFAASRGQAAGDMPAFAPGA